MTKMEMNYRSYFWKPKAELFKKWQLPIVNYLYVECYNYPIKSEETHNYMSAVHPGITISRASVINFMNGLHCAGYLECWVEKGRGGDHFKYKSTMTLDEFIERVLGDVSKKLQEEVEGVK
jgi:hypothetical protein